MQLHTLQSKNKKSRKQRIGRGGKRGSFSGRGIKGQKARAGRKIRPEMRDLIMKMPKRRGHRHTGPKKTLVTVSASAIAKKFKEGEKITPKTLIERGLVSRVGGKTPPIKILGSLGVLSGMTIIGCTTSRQKEQ
jgi:large subunit ribosomal protein L15